MKVLCWIIWAIATMELLGGQLYPWRVIGCILVVLGLVCLPSAVAGKQWDPWYRTQSLIYKALDENESIQVKELIRISQLPPWVVKLVLRKWKKENIGSEDGELFNLSPTGLEKLKEEYGEA